VRPNPLIYSLVYETRERKPDCRDRREKVETQNKTTRERDKHRSVPAIEERKRNTPKHTKLQGRTSDLGVVTKVRSA